MRFGVLGPLEVRTGDGRPVRVRETRLRTLLTALLVRRGQVVPVDRLIDDLWGDAPPVNDVRTLRSKVSLLRRTLEDAEPGGRDLLVSRPPGYMLRVDGDAVDAGRFESLLATARTLTGDPRAKAALLTEAVDLWRGPSAFADRADAPFVRAEARRLEERRLAALGELAGVRLELGEHDVLAGELGELVAAHPLHEGLRAAQVRALYRSGRQSEALASLGDLSEQLRTELGIDPGPELTGLRQSILRQDTALAAAPVRTVPRGNLPAPLTALIGRDEDVRRIGALLASERLVTLTGTGGVGKTRLALEVAARRAEDFPDGAWLVELAAARSGAEVREALAAALELRDDGGAPARAPVDRLADAVARRRLLLVLDNCEHLVEPVAELTARLLRAAPGLRVLATSQEPLAVGGEHHWPVLPLDLPEPGAGRAAESSAVRLFVARVTAAAPGFALGPGNAEAVATVCRRLDGIPLALEMAAARVRVMPVGDLADRLDDRFRVLTAALRGVPERQRTLRATIDWSWGLLGGDEQVVLRRLAVSVDGCTLPAAEAVCAGDGVRAGDVLGLLGRLVDRSLVVHQHGRYRLLESVAAYGLERLAGSGEEQRVRDRHLDHYVGLVERLAPLLRGHEQRGRLEEMDAEAANLRAALAYAVRRGSADKALRLVDAACWYWFLRGRFAEAGRALDLALSGGGGPGPRAAARAWRAGMSLLLHDAPDAGDRSVLAWYDAGDDPAGGARARWFLALGRTGFGDPGATFGLVDRAYAGFRSLGDRWGTAAALSVRAEIALYQGNLGPARDDAERAYALFRELGDGWGELHAARTLGDLAEFTGDYGTSARLRQDGLRLAERLRLWNVASGMLARLGRTALLTGDLDRAEDLHRRARRLAVAHSHERGEEFAEVGLGLVARHQGRLDDAEAHLRAWLDWCRRWEGDHGVALILAELGFIAEQRGDAGTALEAHREGLEHARRTGDRRALARAFEGLAGAHALAGEHEEAARLLGTATALREAVGMPLPAGERGDVDRITTAVRRFLDAASFESAFGRGAERAGAQAVPAPAASGGPGLLGRGSGNPRRPGAEPS
ncbi:tetratricopeptide repeat protein [Streptomyces sp. SID4919]|uniref:BTAD domain-containing putative transcriptional regulator n=1 Tax=unclassified Streptomyces TaxID=2593676 RepID=UPI000C068250|nr:BTAD domain-containing putative transcriptional regulator [Streptomyces sp. AmelKG-E11A]MYY10219.1 tetratricopeptide repeat protein [Streptomyces sp. SID4919]